MNLRQHCVSLETAKRMKELGWKKATFAWYQPNGLDVFCLYANPPTLGMTDIAAPIASEIMEELPRSVKVEKNKYTFSMGKNSIEYCVGYHRRDSNKDMHYRFTCHCANIAEALALLWCTLREKGII